MASPLSAGVYWTEYNLTTIVPSVSVSVGAYAGYFPWGPLQEVVNCTSELDIVNKFYKPTETNFVDFFTCANFTAYADNLQIVRTANTLQVLNSTCANLATSNVTSFGLYIPNQTYYTTNYIDFSAPDVYGLFAARYAGALGDSLQVSMFSDSGNVDAYNTWQFANEFAGCPGTSLGVATSGGKNDQLHVIVIDQDGLFTGVPGTVLEKFAYASKASDAMNSDGTSNYYVNLINQSSRYIYVINSPGVELANVANVTVISGGSGHFSANDVYFTGGSGNGAIGNVVCNTTGAVVRVDVENAGSSYLLKDTLQVPLLQGTGAILTLSTVGANGNVSAITITAGGKYYMNANNIVVSGGSGDQTLTLNLTANVTTGAINGVTVAGQGNNYVQGDTVTGIILADYGVNAVTQLVVNLQDAAVSVSTWGLPSACTVFDQTSVYDKYTASLVGGTDGVPQDGDVMEGYDFFSDPTAIDIGLVMLGGHSSQVGSYVVQNVIGGSNGSSTGRRDAVAFVSPRMDSVVNSSGQQVTNVVADRNAYNFSSSYAVMDSGWKKQYDKYNNKYRWVPLNGDIAGLCAYTDYVRDAWWSPAGFNRGQIKNVTALAWSPNQPQRDTLYSNGVNPVVNFKGQGAILYGDKTMLTQPSAFDRINVRRLFIVLEKAIVLASQYSLFEFNDQFTRAAFVAMIEPYLRDVKGRRGIYDFKVVCDETNNTPQVIDSNQFVGDLYIKPAHAINFIQLNFVAVGTGVSFSEIVGKFGGA